MDGFSIDAGEEGEIDSMQFDGAEHRCLSLLDSLDEMLQLLRDATTVGTCGRPDMLPTICSVYDEVRYIVSGLRKVCMQQLRNSQDIMSLLQLLIQKEPHCSPAAGATAAEVTAVSCQCHPGLTTLERQQDETVGLRMQPQPDQQLLKLQQPEVFTSAIEPEDAASHTRMEEGCSITESNTASALTEESRSLQLQMLHMRVQLQNERDLRRTAEQHLQIMKQKDLLRRIEVQKEADKVRVKEDHIRFLEMVISDLRHRSTAS